MPLAFQRKVSAINNRCQFLNLLSDMTGAILNSFVGATERRGDANNKTLSNHDKYSNKGFTEEYVNDEFCLGKHYPGITLDN